MSESNDWQIPGNGAEIYGTVFVPAMLADWAAKAVSLARPQPGEHVLDVACGTGVVTRHAAESVGSKGRVVGLDITPEMLAVARKLTPDSTDAAVIEWREGDVAAMPFDDESFDVVFCAFALMFFPDPIAALKEMRRVLKPRGRLMVMVWGAIHKSPGQAAMKESWERHFGAERAALYLHQHSLSDPQRVGKLLLDAGFSDVSVEPVMGSVHFPSPEPLVRGYGAMSGLQADAATRSAVLQEVSAALQPYVGAEGLVYPIEAVVAQARK